MRTATGANTSKISQELLAALLTGEGIQPELDDDVGARLLVVGDKGKDRANALVLAPEVKLRRLDIQLDGSKDGSRQFDLCKDSSRFRVFWSPEAPAPYTESLVFRDVKRFMKTVKDTSENSVKDNSMRVVDGSEAPKLLMEQGRSESDKVWMDVFGAVESKLVSYFHNELLETPDGKLEVFASKKLTARKLQVLQPVVPEGWKDVMRRATIDLDRFDIESVRVRPTCHSLMWKRGASRCVSASDRRVPVQAIGEWSSKHVCFPDGNGPDGNGPDGNEPEFL
ncbi:hypothetical protein GNI_109570 [Gregarina niphandrodes]|uniref:Uncharacterized protein n=1 Tax=Gregarina niphandrodes TaxID=110365 RepID=A0A023B3N0_GRENI|nr:hypothetical protein GNI_109570 [Gregarina niphandrodes]EZG55697.1 hypothetical protein GNI_109570 [Gregarina niphandrodes]|eukprot:XP_011131459.1 hypothetical protein GNI_109570 [Gregarina niphandrodes]